MKKIDFGYRNRETGFTIFKQCFLSQLKQSKKLKSPMISLKQKRIISKKAIKALEDVFMYLIEKGDQNGFDVNAILQIPCISGSTCFSDASQLSEKITKKMLERGIQVNSIDASMVIPSFKFPNAAMEMLNRQVNPRISRYDGKTQIDLYRGITK